jgi:hypothetical protein
MNSSPGGAKNRSANVQGAISADGSRVFWTDTEGLAGKIYVREHPEQGQVPGECSAPGIACTTAVSAKGEELSGRNKSHFWAAAADGSKAIFTAVEGSASLGLDLPGSGVDLYEFDVEAEQTQLIAPQTLGVLGVSKDASHVYFASAAVLGGANGEGDVAVAGKANLYHSHAGAIEFVGTLAAQDSGAIATEPRFHSSRVSPDGLHAAFVSRAPLTGYDNLGAGDGKATPEAFLYDAQQGKLICVSCNPSNARPAGPASIPFFQNILYASRALADDGSRLYFESDDALAARDTNGVQDVYQWEELGRGGCEEADASFSAEAEGCIEPISSGQSARASEFLDADPDGSDVFFTTLSSLRPEDYGLVDVYDARIDGGFPPPPAPAAGCEGEACQSPPGPPAEPSLASSSFSGQGNRRSGPAPRERCGKGRRKARKKGGKGRCVKRAQHKRGRAAR